jgi:orotate phosphoribosyltransferase
MDDPKIMQIFADVGAVVSNSHFVYSSGRHSSVYINKDALYIHSDVISKLCRMMVRSYTADQIDVVVGPVLGGIVLSQWVAYYLNEKRSSGETLAIFAEKESDGPDKQFAFHRGYDKYLAGKNRGNVQPTDVGGVPIQTLINVTLETYSEEECPFCKQNVPINTELGKGRAFLAKKKRTA